jgi:Sucrase/ferredoxin-like
VCTHGKHDRCCSKFGRPLYDAVREQVEDGWVWQSSHVGGDRFAGNLVSLPDGAYHGRVEPGEAWTVLDAALRGEVHLPRYRGRSCHSFPAQAAERAVREHTGVLGVVDVRVASCERSGDGWAAVVESGGTAWEVDVRRELGEPTHLTCSTEQLRRPSSYVGGTPRARAS